MATDIVSLFLEKFEEDEVDEAVSFFLTAKERASFEPSTSQDYTGA